MKLKLGLGAFYANQLGNRSGLFNSFRGPCSKTKHTRTSPKLLSINTIHSTCRCQTAVPNEQGVPKKVTP